MTHNNAKLTFWGVRGSTPTLDRETWRYGGNTPCLELTAPGGTKFILDCGTGLRMLGNHWMQAHAGHQIEAHTGYPVLSSVLRITKQIPLLQLPV